MEKATFDSRSLAGTPEFRVMDALFTELQRAGIKAAGQMSEGRLKVEVTSGNRAMADRIIAEHARRSKAVKIVQGHLPKSRAARARLSTPVAVLRAKLDLASKN